MSTSYPPHYAYPSAPPLQRALPSPPRLHWAWVLVLSIVTFGIFGSVWLLVQAVWIRRMRGGKSTGFWLSIANVALLPAFFFYGMVVGVAARMFPSDATASLLSTLGPIARLVSFVLYVSTAFAMRRELEQDPIGIPLGGVMTFFFAPLYFQYHLRDYNGGYAADGGLSLRASATPDAMMQPVEYPPPPPQEPLPPFGPSA